MISVDQFCKEMVKNKRLTDGADRQLEQALRAEGYTRYDRYQWQQIDAIVNREIDIMQGMLVHDETETALAGDNLEGF